MKKSGGTWQEILPRYGTLGITGKRREGKTVLGYYLCQLRYELLGAEAVVFGPLVRLQDLLPPWLKIVDDLQAFTREREKTLFLDEGSLPLHARQAMTRSSTLFDQMMSLSGQRHQLFIWCTHHTRKLDVLRIMDLDLLACKYPSKMYVEFERPEVRWMTKRARDKLSVLQEDIRRKWTYVFYDDFDQEALMSNPLPGFWSQALSEAVATAQDEDEEKRESASLDPDAFPVTLDQVYRRLNLVIYEWWDEYPLLRKALLEVAQSLENGEYQAAEEGLKKKALVLAGNRTQAETIRELAFEIAVARGAKGQGLDGGPLKVL